MGREQFIGTWKLVSSEIRLSDGQLTYPLGTDAVGRITYDTAGHMLCQLVRLDRPAFASGDQWGGTPEETKAAFQGCIAYFGTYEVNEQEGTVIHHVEGSLFPNWVGTDQRRFFEFSGKQLTLTTPPIPAGGQQATARLVYERLG